MKSCDDIRTAIACGEDEDQVALHITTCDVCRQYSQKMQLFEPHLAHVMRVQPPEELTARLLAIAADHAMPPVRVRQPWWSTLLAFLIGVIAVMASVSIIAELVVLFGGPFGFGTYAADIVQLPGALYSWMRKVVPSVTDALTTIDAVRLQLIVILMLLSTLFVWYGQRNAKQRNNQ